jgi:DNA-3-methyladenine glycosylase
MGIDGQFDGVNLLSGDSPVQLVDDGTPPPTRPSRGPRIGISVATDLQMRWWVTDDPFVSGARVSPKRVANPG